MSPSTILTSPFVAMARFWRRRRRTRQWEHKRREFVYLDDTSVTSLVAARHGSVPESFKETLSATTSSEVGSALTVPATPSKPGVALSTRSASSRSTSQEVVHRAVIQGTFRGLRIGDSDLRLSIEDQPARTKPAAVSTSRELTRHLAKLEKQHRAVRTADLLRGDVLEVQVELSPEWSYQIAAAVSSMIDLVDGRSAMFGIEETAVAEVRHLLELISRLLVDLVPIQARLTSHRLVVVDDVPWLLDASMITAGSALDREADDVHLAGVTELPLYWKDVRRVLFAGSTYSVYARVSKPGIQPLWSPVKLADVFDRFLPDVGEQIRALPHLFGSAQDVSGQVETLSVTEVLRDKGLVPFGRDLALLASRKISEARLLEIATDAAQAVTTSEELRDVGLVRSTFEPVVTAVEASPLLNESNGPRGSSRIDRHLVRMLRDTHQAVARLTFLNESATTGELSIAAAGAASRLIEAEVVAIYW